MTPKPWQQAVAMEAADPPASPHWAADVPQCSEECAHFDGKRCRALGFPPGSLCEPVVAAMTRRLSLVEAS